jgi:hypothetical protein
MPVALLPPTSTGLGDWRGQTPLASGPRYIRGAGNSRWHRTRAAVIYPACEWREQYTHYTYWCGQGASSPNKMGPLWLVDELPADQPACGTCVGRALGAKQDDLPRGLPPLRFDPRWQASPALCPGGRNRDLVEPLDERLRVGRCIACGVLESIRAMGRGYDRYGYALVSHPPGPELCEPCPFHAWQRIVERDGKPACGCGWPGGAS